MNNVYVEGNLVLDFNACGLAEKFDVANPYGMKGVDFVVETEDFLYFIEVKDFQNPKTPQHQQKNDDEMLISAIKDKKSIFTMEMGAKIKDSLLRRYAENIPLTKKVIYLLLINFDKLGEFERGKLKEKISGHVPTGLNAVRFNAFASITFNLVNAKQIACYGIDCKVKST